MKTYEWELSASYECITPDISFLNCEECAESFALENNLDIKNGAHRYSDENENGVSLSECWACGHEFDYPPTCDGCGTYIKGDLTDEGRAYMLESLSEWPAWLVDYYLGAEYVERQKRLIEAESSSHPVIIDGEIVGYHTRLGGLYVCVQCGHLCECNQEEEGI